MKTSALVVAFLFACGSKPAVEKPDPDDKPASEESPAPVDPLTPMTTEEYAAAVAAVNIPDAIKLPAIPDPNAPLRVVVTPKPDVEDAPATASVAIKLLEFKSQGGNTRITLSRANGVVVGTRGFLLAAGKPIAGSNFKIDKVTGDTAQATVNLALDKVQAAQSATVTVTRE